MPTYGYQCKECGHSFEVFQKITDAALTDCNECGGAVKKLLYPVGIQFKGSGFHVNDYSRSSSGTAAKETKSESSSDTKTTSSEAKPAASAAS